MNIWRFIKKNNILVLFFFTLISISIGFAAYNQILNLSGNVSLVPGGVLAISSVKTVSLTNATANPEVSEDNTGVEFGLSFTTVNQQSPTYEAVFEITISNQTFEDFVFAMPNYRPTVSKMENGVPVLMEEYAAFVGWHIEGAEMGDKILAKQPFVFRVVFTFSNPEDSYGVTYKIDADFVPNVNEDDTAQLMASVEKSSVGDLRGTNNSANFTLEVINTYSIERTFTIGIKNTDKFVIVNPDTVYTVPSNTEEPSTYTFTLAKADGVEYPYDSTSVDIVIISEDVEHNAGNVEVLVDQTIVINDSTPPTVSDVVAEIANEEGVVNLSWEATDNVKVVNYIIYIYKLNGDTYELYDDINTNSHEKSISLTNVPEGTVYFVVAGIDNSGNTASQTDIDNATSSEGYACKTADLDARWTFNVTVNVTNMTHNGASTVKRGETYTVTFTVGTDSGYKLPESVDSITMGGETVSNFDYTDGVVTVPNVTGDLVITASGIWDFVICLVEGTDILLADGTYKKIEDVEYTDLLMVYDHLNGGMTKVYPVWIEKTGGKTDMYEKITFDDGTVLKVAGMHCLFDAENNMYVDVSNKEQFDIGSKVYKVNEKNELQVVTVKDISYINETVNYYDVLSTTHYNVIANGLITTDIITQFTNELYKFKDKAVYKEFELREQSEQLDYNLVNIIPYDWFKGCNLNNTMPLIKAGKVDMFELGAFLLQRGREHMKINDEIHFIVTTDKDNVTEDTVNKYLYKQGSEYILPDIGAKKFIDTSNNDEYKPGDKYIVTNNTHFKVVY